MKNILILGAGRSATSLIEYLLDQSVNHDWQLRVGEVNLKLAEECLQGHPRGEAFLFDIKDEQQCDKEIGAADLVISMLPARFHITVANACAKHAVDLLTASYLTDDIKSLNKSFKENGKTLVMECGLDPGIDHMSGMRVLNQIKEQGFKLTGFETFTGGLLAPNTDDNPWQYKFTWNPRNVVLAGQGIVKFIQEGKMKFIPYHRLFRRYEMIHIPGYGYFEGYANRDSLKYLDVYGLEGIGTLYRGTLRRPGFCKAWNVFVQLGATDDSYVMSDISDMTHREFINSFLYYNPHDSVELKLAHYLSIDLEAEIMYRLRWLGIFDNKKVGLDSGSPAQILEHILKKKWTLEEDEKDMIVMWHKFDFLDGEKKRQIQSHMVLEGKDSRNTAMSLTVGLPLGIAAKMLLTGEINTKGVLTPTEKALYDPILDELESFDVKFVEKEVDPQKTQTVPLS